jgi:steroid delta-isomerase-like uncharacterized protein
MKMSEQENTKIAMAFYDHFNAHDLDAIGQLQADDFKSEAAGGAGPMNKEQDRMYLQNFLTAFPDLHFEVTLTVAQGDHVVVNWVGSGTHNGPLGTSSGSAIEPTGKKATVPGSSTYQIKDGKIARSATYWDMAGLLGQLGLLPPM